MKRLSNIFAAAAVSLLLTGCGIYNKYEQKTQTPADIFGNSQEMKSATGETSIAQMSWREFFTDPLLQQLIEQVLANNTDLNSARIAVEKSQASLTAAKLAYLPALQLAPQGTLSKFDKNPWSKTYDLPLQLSMDIDVFGSITNKKRAAKAVLLQAQMQQEAVRANLISITAQQYFLLQVLDRQLEILTQTDSLWNKSLDTEKALWENGKAYSTAVNQMEASYLNVKTQIVDTRLSTSIARSGVIRPCIMLMLKAMAQIGCSTPSTYTLAYQPRCLNTVLTSVWQTTPWRRLFTTRRLHARHSIHRSHSTALSDGPIMPVRLSTQANCCSLPSDNSHSPFLPVAV